MRRLTQATSDACRDADRVLTQAGTESRALSGELHDEGLMAVSSALVAAGEQLRALRLVLTERAGGEH